MVEFTTPIIRVSIINALCCIFDNENTELYMPLSSRSLSVLILHLSLSLFFMMRYIYFAMQASHKNGTKLSFYSMPEYDAWRERLGNTANAWAIKYYKVSCCEHGEPPYIFTLIKV